MAWDGGMSRLDGMAVVKTNRAVPAATMMLMLLGGWHGMPCCPMIKFTYINAPCVAIILQLQCDTHSAFQSFLAAFEACRMNRKDMNRPGSVSQHIKSNQIRCRCAMRIVLSWNNLPVVGDWILIMRQGGHCTLFVVLHIGYADLCGLSMTDEEFSLSRWGWFDNMVHHGA